MLKIGQRTASRYVGTGPTVF